MAIPIQAVYTPDGGSDINLLTFPYEEDFELSKDYRRREQQGTLGEYLVKLDTKAKEVVTDCLIESATLQSLFDNQGTFGVLTVRGVSVPEIKLANATKIKDLDMGYSVVDGKLITTPTKYIVRLRFVREV